MESNNEFKLNSATGYFQKHGVDVMAFDDFYPEGHQSGLSIIMHGNRMAANGDLFLEHTPGQWSPMSRLERRELNETENTIIASLGFPGSVGYAEADFNITYKITVKGEGESIIVTVDIDNPLPDRFNVKLCFNLELFPGNLFGKPWIMDGKSGIFPEQPNGPVAAMPLNAGELLAEPYAIGKRLTIRPDDPYQRLTIATNSTELKLYDGRLNHNNGWFVISAELPPGAAQNAVQWIITPNAVQDWLYNPVIQVSQLGYHPRQPKAAIIELDKRESKRETISLFRITETGAKMIFSANGQDWGQFLRYHYCKFDFTDITEEGLYQIRCGDSQSSIFRIANDIYDRGVWQPVLEYFLPVQMCHMRVNEKYRVWHDLCHDDDAQMAPVNHNHFDGYAQGPSTLTKYKPGDLVPGLNIGGWHDAGDDDLRIESQAGEIYVLTMAYEEFNVNYDSTTIDQKTKIVEIHQPDGKNDILQQIEHGALSILGAYRSLGRLYRGIISSSMRQYVILGDTSAMTDNIPGNADDRWVFTEDLPWRELQSAAYLAAASRALKGFNDPLSDQALVAARELYNVTKITDDNGEQVQPAERRPPSALEMKIFAAVELFISTGDQEYRNFILSQTLFIINNISETGWYIARVDRKINDPQFSRAIHDVLPGLKEDYDKKCAQTPYGVVYRPYIWGAGWDIQRRGFRYYFLHKAYPEIFKAEMIFNALNFVMGCHPGSNNVSFASGIGAESATVAYGLNRADWSYIPGGVISGTALIRPDFPELKVFPYLWQQTEYVLGGGSSHYMFLVLAAQKICCSGGISVG